MKKYEYLSELEKRLSALPADARRDALNYYEEYFDAAGPDNEDATAAELGDPAEAARRIEAGEPHVWRLKVPLEHGPIEFDDAVYGHMSFPADVMDDMIVVRTDGTPTYNFAVVCDDANMGITHVIRGDDHLSNTPRQILLYEALGLPVPRFGQPEDVARMVLACCSGLLDYSAGQVLDADGGFALRRL